MASKLARFSWLPGGLAATVVLAVGRLVTPDATASLEATLYDRVHLSAHAQGSDDIVVVTIDDASLEKLGEWPWARDVHATLMDRLRADGANVIAWTVPFGSVASGSETQRVREALALLEGSALGNSEQAAQLRTLLQNSTNVDPDDHLAAAIRAHGKVVLPVEVRFTGEPSATTGLPRRLLVGASSRDNGLTAAQIRLPKPVFLDAASAAGHIEFIPDADGIVRRDIAIAHANTGGIPSLAVATAATALNVQPDELLVSSRSIRIGAHTYPLDERQRLLAHYSPPSAFRSVPYWRALAGDVPATELHGRIVLIGFGNAALSDAATQHTPGSVDSSTVTTVASVADSLLNRSVYSHSRLTQTVEWIAMVCVVLIAAFALPAAGVGIATIAAAVVIAILLVTEVGLLTSTRGWAQLMLPALAMLVGYVMFLFGELIPHAHGRGAPARDTTTNLRTLGQTFQQQGQLDLAFETYRRCPLDAPTMELLYNLGLDFERRRQTQKAAAVYAYIATRDPNYRELRARRARVKEEPAREAPSPEPAARDPERALTRPVSTEPRPGARTLGRYEIERELGKGAMGVVYLGRDPKINRVVAIKAIPLAEEFEEDDLEEARARFFREAEMAGRLNHPSIVTVYDAGEDQGLAYIAMEYLRGQHLSHYTDPARLLPPRSVISLVARVADALHYAHRQNVVHRDIKPANIMFNSDTDELKITDFGIARLTDTSRTKTGIVLGTPSFMSPEQLEGRTLDGRSDQFALAVSLYQLLCGQLPFRAESMPRLMQKIATEDHPPIRSIRPDLPECIEPVLDRALSKSADDRYPTCADLANALRACAQQLTPAKPAQAEHEWLLP